MAGGLTVPLPFRSVRFPVCGGKPLAEPWRCGPPCCVERDGATVLGGAGGACPMASALGWGICGAVLVTFPQRMLFSLPIGIVTRLPHPVKGS